MNLLQGQANWCDRDEPGDVEEERQNDDRENMCEYDEPGASIEGSLLSKRQ